MALEQDLSDFFTKILGEVEGTLRTATRSIDQPDDLSHRLFKWPSELPQVIEHFKTSDSQHLEMFFSPDLYTIETSRLRDLHKGNVLGTQSIFVDLDGTAPLSNEWYSEHDLPVPTIRVRTSEEINQHVYWLLSDFTYDMDLVQNIRQTLAYDVSADPSGWDAGQLLRVPFSTNYKYARRKRQPEFKDAEYPVLIEEETDSIYLTSNFKTSTRQETSQLVDSSINLSTLPKLEDILLNHNFKENFKTIWRSNPKVGSRSTDLSKMAHIAAEIGINNPEMYVLIEELDKRWEIYTNRTFDKRHQIYIRLIDYMNLRHPRGKLQGRLDDIENNAPRIQYFLDYVRQEITLEYIFHNLLPEKGYMFLTGVPNVGKTPLSIRLAVAAALGKDFLGWRHATGEPMPVSYYQLETDADVFIELFKNMPDIEDQHGEELQQNLSIITPADGLGLDNEERLNIFLDDLEVTKPKLLIFDSVSYMYDGDLSKTVDAINFNKLLRKIRRAYECAIIIINHNNKRDNSRKHIGDMDEMAGSKPLSAAASTILSMINVSTELDAEDEFVQLVTSKMKHGKKHKPKTLKRTASLDYEETDLPDQQSKPSGGLSMDSIRKGLGYPG